MKHEIYAKTILANMLLNPDISEISFKNLNDMSTKIERKIPNVTTVINKNMIVSAVEDCPNIFGWHLGLPEDTITRSRDFYKFDLLSNIDIYFNDKLPKSIRKKFVEIVSPEKIRQKYRDALLAHKIQKLQNILNELCLNEWCIKVIESGGGLCVWDQKEIWLDKAHLNVPFLLHEATHALLGKRKNDHDAIWADEYTGLMELYWPNDKEHE